MSKREKRLITCGLAIGAILLLGFTLRVRMLDNQSMWSDEGLSIYRAQLELGPLFSNVITIDGIDTTDTNPPFYFFVLHVAQALTGKTVFALRYQGVLASMIAIALMFCWVRLFASSRVAVVAAFFIAISPFHIWESQILRNYPLLITLNLFSIYGLFRFMLRPQDRYRRRWLTLWILAGLLGIYTHYFAFLVFAFGLLSLALWLVSSRLSGRAQRSAAIGHRFSWRAWLLPGFILLLSLPAVAVGLDRFGAGRQIDFQWVPPIDVATHVVAALGVGFSPSLTYPWWLWLPAALLALLGFGLTWRKSRLVALLLLGYLIVPLALLMLLSTINPLYNGVRHLLISLPPYIALMALGVGSIPHSKVETLGTRLFSLARIALAIIIVVVQLKNLNAQYNDPAFVHDDIRSPAQYLTQVTTADDLVILHDTLIQPTFDYYYRGAAKVIAIPEYGEEDEAEAIARLLEAGTASHIWFLTQPTPRTGFSRDLLPKIAESEWVRFYRHQFPSLWLPVRLEGYVAHIAEPTLSASAHPLQKLFGNKIRLDGYELPSTTRAGSPWWGRFYLTPLLDGDATFHLSLQLVDEFGEIWMQASYPILPKYNLNEWNTGMILQYDQEYTVPVGIPPGEYSVMLRVLSDGGESLPTEDGAYEIQAGTMTVEASQDPQQLVKYTSQPTRRGPLEFLGYRLAGESLRPGHILPLEAIWQARQAPDQDYQVKLEMLDNDGDVLSETISPLTRRSYPTSLWQPGDVVKGHLDLVIPTAPSEVVTLQLTLLNAEGRRVGQPIGLQKRLSIVPWPFVTQLPPVDFPLSVTFSEAEGLGPPLISLRGYDAPATGRASGAVELKLYWQSMIDIDLDLFVFVHLTDAAGNIVAQADGVPVNGTRLTRSWRADEVLVDEYTIQLPAGLQPGSYQLLVGFYDPQSGERLVPRAGATVWPDNRLLLATLTIQESP